MGGDETGGDATDNSNDNNECSDVANTSVPVASLEYASRNVSDSRSNSRNGIQDGSVEDVTATTPTSSKSERTNNDGKPSTDTNEVDAGQPHSKSTTEEASSTTIATSNTATTAARRRSPRPGLSELVGSSLRSIHSAITGHAGPTSEVITYYITARDLSKLAEERSRLALASLLEKHLDAQNEAEHLGGIISRPPNTHPTGTVNIGESETVDGAIDTVANTKSSRSRRNIMSTPRVSHGGDSKMSVGDDLEMGEGSGTHSSSMNPAAAVTRVYCDLRNLIHKMRVLEGDESLQDSDEGDAAAEEAAAALASIVLHSSSEVGLDATTSSGATDDDVIQKRKAIFGENAIAPKKLDSFLKLCFQAAQDFVLIMLITLGIVSIVIENTIGSKSGGSYIEGAAILVAVMIVVLVTAGIDYQKQCTFARLSQTLDQTNTKSAIRRGEQVSVVDADIVVGDIISVNSHNLASIPADCVLLGPSTGTSMKLDEASLTGEGKLITKKPGDVILSGTNVVQGAGKMIVIAVGVNSVAGKIRARVYEANSSASPATGGSGDGGENEDSDGDEDQLEGDEETPLFSKLSSLARQIGVAGTVAALIAFAASCIIGLAINGEPASSLIGYFIVSVTVLAVAVPEGLPLAVTLSLAFSSNRMTKDQNLVKHLDACETMGCATTICTDKTGTLTANKMTARAIYVSRQSIICTDPSQSLGDKIQTTENKPSPEALKAIADLISIDTMNESVLEISTKNGQRTVSSSGNPTEGALLILVHDIGHDYHDIRVQTRGRSDVGEIGKHLSDGKQFGFSSARKMMSWAVPLDGGGYRIYTKGASEVVIGRCISQMLSDDSSGIAVEDLTDAARSTIWEVAEKYARRGMRCLALAYRDLPSGVHFDEKSTETTNSDGKPAYSVETDLVFASLVGIEDPLRPEVPAAISSCYEAGIDVRMVTGDAPNTAVSIAHQAGILREEHFKKSQDGQPVEMVADNLKNNVLMEGKVFRERVYRMGLDGKKEFDQHSFDKIWPFLRVLARSSPDDKLTLAHGLNQSTLFTDKDTVRRLRKERNISIFPDRQVIAMTGDGTNDAPALKRADIGFAMGIAGTQIAKDAADIILLDDNFASIVTAAKWGRNVYASVQKFLQFQLTVNISAVTAALVGSFAFQRSPLAAIQLLWVNLLMDSLASLALASEPPKDDLLKKPPVNRTEHLITKRMWANMIGQAGYQIIVVLVLLFQGPTLFNIPAGNCVEDGHCQSLDGVSMISVHYTIIFNAFVWMQLFNEINCRNLKGEVCVFRGVEKNPLFCGIWITTAALQVIMVQFGSDALHVAVGGLDAKYWGICIALGVGSLPVQQIINFTYGFCQKYRIWRMRKDVAYNTGLTRKPSSRHHLKAS